MCVSTLDIIKRRTKRGAQELEGEKNGGKKNWLTAEERSWIEQRIGLVRLEFLGGGGGAWSRRGRRFASATSTAPATSARCGVLLLHASPLKTSISVSLKPLKFAFLASLLLSIWIEGLEKERVAGNDEQKYEEN